MACYQDISFKPLGWSLAVEIQSNITLTYVVIFLLAVNATLFGESYFKVDLCKIFMLGQFGYIVDKLQQFLTKFASGTGIVTEGCKGSGK